MGRNGESAIPAVHRQQLQFMRLAAASGPAKHFKNEVIGGKSHLGNRSFGATNETDRRPVPLPVNESHRCRAVKRRCGNPRQHFPFEKAARRPDHDERHRVAGWNYLPTAAPTLETAPMACGLQSPSDGRDHTAIVRRHCQQTRSDTK